MSHRVLLPCLLSVLLAAPARADVIVADPPLGPTAQQAIDIASPGDIVLIKPSAADDQANLSIDGKGIALVADGAGLAFRRLYVGNVPAGEHLTVQGLTFGWALHDWYDNQPFYVYNCEGSVWFDSCEVFAPEMDTYIVYIEGPPAVRAVGCDSVLFTNCTITGGKGADGDGSGMFEPSSPGGPGLSVSYSKVSVYGSTCTGGGGAAGLFGPPEDGGAGIWIGEESEVHIAGTTATGGMGGKVPGGGSAYSGSGLEIELQFEESSCTIRDSVIAHGPGSKFHSDIETPEGAVTTYPAPARSLTVTSPLREAEVGALTVHAEQGDLVAVFTAFRGGALPLPGKQGVFALGTPFFGPFILGTVTDPGGELSLPFTAPSLTSPALEAQVYLLQLVVHDGSQVLFEDGSVFVLLDASIP